MEAMGLPALLGTATIRVVLTQDLEPVGEYGTRMETRYVMTMATQSGGQVGDIVSIDGVSWLLGQLLTDDGFIQTYSVRMAS